MVITGEYKDLKKPRTVMKIIPDKSRVLVEGVNMVTKHEKPSAQNTKGGITRIEAPIAISNVMLWDSASKAASKVKRSRVDGKLVRIAKKSGEEIK